MISLHIFSPFSVYHLAFNGYIAIFYGRSFLIRKGYATVSRVISPQFPPEFKGQSKYFEFEMSTFGERLDLATITIFDEFNNPIFEYIPQEPDILKRDWIMKCVNLKPDQTLFVIQAHVHPREGEYLPCSTTTLDNFKVALGRCVDQGWSSFPITRSSSGAYPGHANGGGGHILGYVYKKGIKCV